MPGWGFLLLMASVVSAAAGVFEFPTKNHALADGHPEDFFMYVDRDFEGAKSQPWEGGQYGFVRGPHRDGGEVVCTTFHEGIDIKPMLRDAVGNPLDDILAAADGTVVHVSAQAGASNYGRYIVIEHQLDGCPYYTLYAHLASVSVAVGQKVRQGDVVARMGFSGAGIDRQRAHLHFEVGMIYSRDFEDWYKAHAGGDPNVHGIYHGYNLIGTDPARVLLASARDPQFRISSLIASSEPAFKVTIPNSSRMSLLKDYPWLVATGQPDNPPAWTISFTAALVPVRAVASPVPVAAPRLDWVRDSKISYAHATKNIIAGPPGSPHLTEGGKRFLSLLSWPE